jgi:hypothetical protein
MDVLGAFLADRCVKGSTLKVPVGDLHRAYAAWCDEHGEEALTKRDLGIELSERGFTDQREKNVRYRVGLDLVTRVTDDDAAFDKTPDHNPHEGTYLKPASPPSPTSPVGSGDAVASGSSLEPVRKPMPSCPLCGGYALYKELDGRLTCQTCNPGEVN